MKPDAKPKILEVVWWGVALGIVVGCTLTGISGFDWLNYYYPQAQQVVYGRILNPLWIYLVLTPLGWLPFWPSYVIFTVLNVGMVRLAGYLTGINSFLLLLSFPGLWLLWYGQIDGFVMLGIAIVWYTIGRDRNPILLGIAMLLLLVKPHLGGPVALLCLWWSRNRWQTLGVFGLFFGFSLVMWDWRWPRYWLNNLFFGRNTIYTGQQINISLFPYGLIAWTVLLLPLSRQKRLMGAVAATFLSAPYAPAYSLLSLIVLPVPLLSYLIVSAPLLLGPKAYWVATLVPLMVLGWLVWPHLKLWRVQMRPKQST